MERFTAGLIIKNITIIKVGTDKSFIQSDRADLGKKFCKLRMRPILLFILHSTVSRCFSKDNRVSRMIPRCLWDAACITLLLLNASGGCDAALDFRLKICSDGPRIASEVMSGTFRSITQSNNARSRRKGSIVIVHTATDDRKL